MGITESKTTENQEFQSGDKHRMQFMKEAVSSRKTFFSALSAYSVCLKNTGAALADGVHSNFSNHPLSSLDFLPSRQPFSNFHHQSPHSPPLWPMPPPPPMSDFSLSPLQRASSIPEIIMKSKPELPTVIEEGELELEAEELTSSHGGRGGSGVQPPEQQQLKDEAIRNTTVYQGSAWEYFFMTDFVEEELKETVSVELPMTVRPMGKKRGANQIGRSREAMNLRQIFGDIDDHFLKAFESTLEVSDMLEGTRLHYHSNFADNPPNGDIDKKISDLVSWDQSLDGMQGDDDPNTASVLDKMLAWEIELYNQVITGKVIKAEYQKTLSLLNEQKKQGSNPKSLVKLNTALSHLHAKHIVQMQLGASTIAEINRTHDEQLYPRLVQLVDGMEKMWKTMLIHHESQTKIVYSMIPLDNSQTLKKTSEYRYYCTIQLYGAACYWHTQFCGLIEYQKTFIRALHSWSKLTLMPIESNLKEKGFSPRRIQNTPIHALLTAWKNDLDGLPDEVARNAILKFAGVVQAILHQQDRDLNTRGSTQFQDRLKDDMKERASVVISLKRQLEEDEEVCQTVCKPAAENNSLQSLRCTLVELFRAMSEIAQACSDMYCNLRNIIDRSQHASQNS